MITLVVAVIGYLLTAFGFDGVKNGNALFMAYVCESMLTVFGIGIWLIVREVKNGDEQTY